MTAEEALPLVAIDDFSGTKQTTFFKLLKQPRFSGQLILSDSKGQTWIFFVYLGRLTFVTGGVHSFRSWKRNVLAHCLQLSSFPVLLKQAVKEAADRDLSNCWQYHILCLWVEQQKVTREQAAKVVRAIMVEALFDITQAGRVTYQVKQDNASNTPKLVCSWRCWMPNKWPVKHKSFGKYGRQLKLLIVLRMRLR
jgi:chemotaxis family two-component system response regulator PixG